MEVANFRGIAACDDDFGPNRDLRMRASNCLLNQQSLCPRKLAAPCAQDDLRRHCRNLTRDTLQGKLCSALYSSEARSGFSPREECSATGERRFNPREMELKNSVT